MGLFLRHLYLPLTHYAKTAPPPVYAPLLRPCNPLSTTIMIKWDDTNKVFTDYMGYPLSRTEVQQLRSGIKLHLKKSPADLAQIANERLEKDMPHYTPYKPEKFA